MFPLREWGFDSPLGHHPLLRGLGVVFTMTGPTSDTEHPQGEQDSQGPSFKALLVSNLRILLIAGLLASIAYWLWGLLADVFHEVGWLQYPD